MSSSLKPFFNKSLLTFSGPSKERLIYHLYMILYIVHHLSSPALLVYYCFSSDFSSDSSVISSSGGMRDLSSTTLAILAT